MTESLPTVITLDGPAAAGKGTLSRLLALRLGYHYLDSGALYRLIALQSVVTSEEPTTALPVQTAQALNVRFQLHPEDPDQVTVWLDGRDVTRAIHTEEVGQQASKIAALPALREALVERQRAFRQRPGLIADGRDMGTVIFPDAPLKFFLTADIQVRVHRRFEQLKSQGICTSIAEIFGQMSARDAQDRERQVAPLQPAFDAVVIDSTHCDVEHMLALLEEKVAATLG